jgi:hypothetical protein
MKLRVISLSVTVIGSPFLICITEDRHRLKPAEPSNVPESHRDIIRLEPLFNPCTTFTAIRFEATITDVGLTALSVEMRRSREFRAYPASVTESIVVARTLFLIAIRALTSTTEHV